MNSLLALKESESTASERLIEMLQINPQWDSQSKGLATQIQNLIPQYSYATVYKWLNENTLPRTAEERLCVSNTLDIDLIYWEYGVKSKNVSLRDIDPISALKHSNAVLTILNKKGVNIGESISDDLVIKIQELVCFQSKKNGLNEPDFEFIELIIEIILTHNKI